MKVVLQYEGRWWKFEDPVRVVSAARIEDVQPALDELDNSELYCAGFISYEAAPAFDEALKTHSLSSLPLLEFGLYREPQMVADRQLKSSAKYRLGDWTPSLSRDEYLAGLSRIREYLEAGDTYQVNYTYRLRSAFSGDEWSFFSDLIRAQGGRYSAFIDGGDYVICSASPELFFKMKDGRISARPMKGTAPRGLTCSDDKLRAEKLHRSSKNRAENIMIVDMIRNDIGRLAKPGSLVTSDLFKVEKYPTVWQMTSAVSGGFCGSLALAMKHLFPSASITGAPKARTMEIVRELEGSPRGVYTGSIGCLTPAGDAEFNVAIRTAVVDRKSHSLEYGVGGGVVWDSEASDELEESRIKARILSHPVSDFRLLETMLWDPEEGFFLANRHFKRLQDSGDYFSFPIDLEELRRDLEKFADGKKRGMIRMLVDSSGKPEFQWHDLGDSRGEVRLALAAEAIDASDPFLYHKTTHREVYKRALSSLAGEWDDVILWNAKRELSESCFANLVLEFGGEYLTPPVECGLLAGTLRAELLSRAKLRERKLYRADLLNADAIYLINSVRGWRRAVLGANF